MSPFIRACVRVQSLWHVGDLAFAGKKVRPQAQIVVLVALEVQQKVAVRALRGIDICFLRKVRIVQVELFGEMNELTAVAWILKQYDVLRIQTDRMYWFLLKKFCTMNITETFLWCDLHVNILVSLSSASSIKLS